MRTSLKHALIRRLHAQGIELMKAPGTRYEPIPVFKLAVERLMQLRGPTLRFIQVGANDGVYGDPIRPYILSKGWRGVLVEPQEDVCELLRANYAGHEENLVVENVAIGSGGELTLYRPPARIESDQGVPHGLTVTSGDPRVVSRQTGVPVDRLEKVSVPCVTLDELVERHGLGDLDVLQIDVEGFDLAVLLTLSLNRTRPGLIQFEHGHLTRAQLKTAVRHLSAHGYKFFYGGRQFNDSVAMRGDLFD